MAVKLHTSFTTNQIVLCFNLYVTNSSNLIIPYLCREVGPITKQHGITTQPLTGLFTVSVILSFPFYFPLSGTCRVVLVFTYYSDSSRLKLLPSIISPSFALSSFMVQRYFFLWLSNSQILYFGSDYPPPPESDPHFSRIFLSFLF